MITCGWRTLYGAAFYAGMGKKVLGTGWIIPESKPSGKLMPNAGAGGLRGRRRQSACPTKAGSSLTSAYQSNQVWVVLASTAAMGGRAPKRRWRAWNWRTAASRSSASKSGHMRRENISSA